MDTSTSDEVDLSLMEKVFAKYEDEPGALIPVLQDAQALYGFLPLKVLQCVADRLDLALGKVYSVATYYSELYLDPRGSHVLRICDGTVCHLKGAAELAAAVEDAYGVGPGETTQDGTLTVESVYCLGVCARAPAVALDGEMAGDMQPGKLLKAIDDRRSDRPETPADDRSGSVEL